MCAVPVGDVHGLVRRIIVHDQNFVGLLQWLSGEMQRSQRLTKESFFVVSRDDK